MNASSPRLLSIVLSLIITLMALVAVIVILIFDHVPIPWWELLIVALFLCTVQYFLIAYVLRKFIYDKIKLIYKTIHNLKLTKGEKREKASGSSGDLIRNVNEEVESWSESYREEIDQMKKLETYRREFLANVSHELKTPLFNLQGFTLTLLDGGIHDPEINKLYLSKMDKNIERMITIVEDLEVISRLETGEAKPECSRFDIINLTRDVFEFLEPNASLRGITLMLSNDNYSPKYVYADADKIKQVLVNLIENSIKYGKPQGRTKVSFYEMGENLLIEVSDNGIGIEDQHLPHLFDRFYRVDKHRSRSEGGSGLGLSIVKHIIEAHEQTVNVRSAKGIGSTFAFTLKSVR